MEPVHMKKLIALFALLSTVYALSIPHPTAFAASPSRLSLFTIGTYSAKGQTDSVDVFSFTSHKWQLTFTKGAYMTGRILGTLVWPPKWTNIDADGDTTVVTVLPLANGEDSTAFITATGRYLALKVYIDSLVAGSSVTIKYLGE